MSAETTWLREVMARAQNRAHERLNPSHCDALLVREVRWRENTKRDRFDFVRMRGKRDLDGVEMHELLDGTLVGDLSTLGSQRSAAILLGSTSTRSTSPSSRSQGSLANRYSEPITLGHAGPASTRPD